jgi:hypothetical protein
MSDVRESSSPWKTCTQSTSACVERTIKRGDTIYELFVARCSCCEEPVYRLMRSCGASISIYEISSEDYDNLDEYVETLHTSFSVDVDAKLGQLRDTVREFNSRGLFEAEEIDVHHVRLIDKARLILGKFAKSGVLDRILRHADDIEDEVAAAFVLGCLATENFWIETHADAVFEGYAHIEGRECGRPLAIAARVRQGKRTRKAVIDAASKLYQESPVLRRNDSKTAIRIADMRLEALRKRDGTFLGPEAIVKHLRGARRHGQLLGNSQ